jgi:hypothetical protein
MPRESVKDAPKAAAANRWSYSAWSTMRKCAYQYYCRNIRGMKEPPRSDNRALERGIELHKMQEEYLKGNISVLPKAFKKFATHYKQLKALKPIVEQWWGVDEHWKPIKWGSWVVLKMDAAVLPGKKTDNRLIIQDLKSGREYPDHEHQGALYAAIGFAMFPKIDGCDVEFWYIDGGYPVSFEFSRKQLALERAFWLEEGQELLKPHPEKFYKPNPSDDNCKWCFLRSDKGGPCSAWKVNAKIGRG